MSCGGFAGVDGMAVASMGQFLVSCYRGHLCGPALAETLPWTPSTNLHCHLNKNSSQMCMNMHVCVLVHTKKKGMKKEKGESVRA